MLKEEDMRSEFNFRARGGALGLYKTRRIFTSWAAASFS